jgi:hypothetical protein
MDIDSKTSSAVDDVATAVALVHDTARGCLRISDGELDDTWTDFMLQQLGLRPAVRINLLSANKDRDAAYLKTVLAREWLGDGVDHGFNYTLDVDAEPSNCVLENILEHCVDFKTGRLKIVCTAPCASVIQGLLAHKLLAKLHWDVICYAGAYNIQNKKQVNLLNTLATKISQDPESRLYLAQWFTAMGRGTVPRLTNLSTLLTKEDWVAIESKNLNLWYAVENFLRVFNAGLIEPNSLFIEGTPDKIRIAAAESFACTRSSVGGADYQHYAKFCLTDEVREYVKPKKLGIFFGVDGLAHDAPLADMIIGLAAHPAMKRYWRLHRGTLRIDEKAGFLDIAAGAEGNTFELQLVISDDAIAALHDTVLSGFVKH